MTKPVNADLARKLFNLLDHRSTPETVRAVTRSKLEQMAEASGKTLEELKAIALATGRAERYGHLSHDVIPADQAGPIPMVVIEVLCSVWNILVLKNEINADVVIAGRTSRLRRMRAALVVIAPQVTQLWARYQDRRQSEHDQQIQRCLQMGENRGSWFGLPSPDPVTGRWPEPDWERIQRSWLEGFGIGFTNMMVSQRKRRFAQAKSKNEASAKERIQSALGLPALRPDNLPATYTDLERDERDEVLEFMSNDGFKVKQVDPIDSTRVFHSDQDAVEAGLTSAFLVDTDITAHVRLEGPEHRTDPTV